MKRFFCLLVFLKSMSGLSEPLAYTERLFALNSQKEFEVYKLNMDQLRRFFLQCEGSRSDDEKIIYCYQYEKKKFDFTKNKVFFKTRSHFLSQICFHMDLELVSSKKLNSLLKLKKLSQKCKRRLKQRALILKYKQQGELNL